MKKKTVTDSGEKKFFKPMRISVGDFKLGKEERAAINEVLDSGRLSEGKKTREFEERWAEFIGVKYCVATSSGSAALITGLTALKYSKRHLPQGTKVITTPLTFIADSSAISTVGFEPVYIDVDPDTFGITPEGIQQYLDQTRDLTNHSVILGVDLMGFPMAVDKINKIAVNNDLIFFEDSAQAHGSTYQGKKLGSQASLAIYSFYIAHNIQAGEMGALVTNNPEIYKLAKKIKAQGRACECPVCLRFEGKCPQLKMHNGDDDFDPRFTHELIGYNFKTMEFQSALALTQLKKIDWIIRKRQENVLFLNNHLKKYETLLQLPKYSEEVSYLAYPIVIKKEEAISRRQLRNQLENLGVETRPLFGCIPTQQPAYEHLKNEYQGKLPHAEYIGRNGFYIGCHQYLEKEDLEYIVESFSKIFNELNYRKDQ